MTNTRLNKDLLFLLFFVLLSFGAIFYGFSTIPNPQEQRGRAYDKTRVADLEEISYAVTNYTYDANRLPETLHDITISSYDGTNSDRSRLEDPQTKSPYEYSTTGPTTYKLCATFAAADKDYKEAVADEFTRDFTNHPKGHYCFTKEVTLTDNASPLETSGGGGGGGSSSRGSRPMQKVTPSLSVMTPTITCLGDNCPVSTKQTSPMPTPTLSVSGAY